MTQVQRIVSPAFLLVCGLTAFAFGTSCNHGKTASTQPAIDNVSVRMKWFFAGTMAPWFAGVEEGFFRERGINLTIHPGGPDNSAVKLVAAGSDAFGVAGADEVLQARSKGIPIIAIAVLFKDSPVGFISKKGRGIVTPANWSGKVIEVSYGSNAEIQYKALKEKFGVRNTKEVPYSFNLVPFLEDKVDVSVAYLMDQVVTLKRKGIPLDIIASKEVGINPYGDVIITTESLLRDNPELVGRFVSAARKSLEWSIDHQAEAVTSLVQSNPQLQRDNELAVWSATVPFVAPDGSKSAIGYMERERWEDTLRILRQYGGIKSDVSAAEAFRNLD